MIISPSILSFVVEKYIYLNNLIFLTAVRDSCHNIIFSITGEELRRSSMEALTRAKIRTLKMTVLIVTAFIGLWLP